MKRVRSGIPVGMAMAVLAFGAQSSSASQLNLLPLLQISGEYTDNVYFSDTNKQSDTFFVVNPGIALDYASSNFVGSLAYQVGLQRHMDFDERDNDAHRIDANLGFRLGSGFYIDAGDNLYITNDPLAFDASGDRVQRDSYIYNRFVPGMSYQFSNQKMMIAGRYDRIDVDYDSLTDSEQNGFGANLQTKLGERSSLAFDYFEFHREFDQQSLEFNTIDYVGRRYGFSVDRRFSNRFSAKGFFGYEEREFDQEPEIRNFDSFVFQVDITGEFPEVFSWTIGATQHLNDLAIQGAYKIQRINWDLRRSIAERLRVEFAGYVQSSENEQIPEEADYYGMRFEGQYLVAKFLNVWLGYEYINRDSEDINPYSENRINFGLTLSYGL